MNRIRFAGSNLLMCVIELIIGILLLVNPVGFTSVIINSFGIIMLLAGIGKTIGYFREDPEIAAQQQGLTGGILFSAVGIICSLKAQWVLSVFPMITMAYGIVILIAGVSKLQKAIDLVRIQHKYWFVTLISAVLTLFFSVFILVNPFSSTTFLWTFIGATLLVEAILDLVAYLFARCAD